MFFQNNYHILQSNSIIYILNFQDLQSENSSNGPIQAHFLYIIKNNDIGVCTSKFCTVRISRVCVPMRSRKHSHIHVIYYTILSYNLCTEKSIFFCMTGFQKCSLKNVLYQLLNYFLSTHRFVIFFLQSIYLWEKIYNVSHFYLITFEGKLITNSEFLFDQFSGIVF